jgi:hypothetical protein
VAGQHLAHAQGSKDAAAMLNYLLERGLYAAMAAVLIVPEPATLLVFFGFTLGLLAYIGRFAWAVLRDSDAAGHDEPSQAIPS